MTCYLVRSHTHTYSSQLSFTTAAISREGLIWAHYWVFKQDQGEYVLNSKEQPLKFAVYITVTHAIE